MSAAVPSGTFMEPPELTVVLLAMPLLPTFM